MTPLFLLAVLIAAEPCGLIETFADGKKAAREIFVSPRGSNETGSGSRNAPFLTIAHALRGLRAGDAVRLLPGEYAGGASLANITGSADAPIFIGGIPGEARPVIKGGPAGLLISRARHLVLENLEFVGASDNGVNCDDGGQIDNGDAARHLVFRNLSFRDIGSGKNQDGLKLSGVNDYFVLDCEFTRISAGGSGIDQVGCHRGLIARSQFNEGGNAIQCKGGSENIEVRGNRFLNNAGRSVNIGGSTGFQFFRPRLLTNAPNAEARNIRVIANIFHGGEPPLAFVGAVDCLAANNTIVNPGRWIIRVLQETVSRDGFAFSPCGKNRVINNIFSFDGTLTRAPIGIGGNTDAASFEFANNLWFDSSNPGRSRPTLPAAEANGLYGVDPKLTDSFGSKTAGGKGVKIRGIAGDFRGNCFADPPSIGALESN